ncbi:PREDICTED: uncharacterized protein LOC107063614 [Polistes dominula]|uniref:Uncharacterized protein LOC107063614 n=1 Tax=Polistes dominula TaxID=743375 RepID=A0ABM1HU00_POLDO|nr:PREDICTED: uncharacterized protein LOC107063614 [Polistes dominula]
MATWDGSCHEPEDSNYFFYSGQNSAIHNLESWTFYPSNGSNVFFHSTHAPYSQNTSMMLGQGEQQHIAASCQTDPNFSSSSLNSMPLRDACPDYLNATGGSAQDCQDVTTRNNSTIVEHSNLHPTANEFVPHGMKNYTNQTNASINVSNSEESKVNLPQETYSTDNANKYKNKKYNAKKNHSYKYKETQDYNF